MISPFKFCDLDKNYFLISENKDFSDSLLNFFNNPENFFLWKIDTSRQTITYALKNTEHIPLRRQSTNKKLKNTLEYNQILEIVDSDLMKKYEIFYLLQPTLEKIFKSKGVSNVEWGRIFFSKLLPESHIDTHVDEGKYFNYFDRFHLVISSPENCIFHIRDEDIFLKQGNLYWVNNHVDHWLHNHGKTDRINLIFDARLS